MKLLPEPESPPSEPRPLEEEGEEEPPRLPRSEELPVEPVRPPKNFCNSLLPEVEPRRLPRPKELPVDPVNPPRVPVDPEPRLPLPVLVDPLLGSPIPIPPSPSRLWRFFKVEGLSPAALELEPEPGLPRPDRPLDALPMDPVEEPRPEGELPRLPNPAVSVEGDKPPPDGRETEGRERPSSWRFSISIGAGAAETGGIGGGVWWRASWLGGEEDVVKRMSVVGRSMA